MFLNMFRGLEPRVILVSVHGSELQESNLSTVSPRDFLLLLTLKTTLALNFSVT